MQMMQMEPFFQLATRGGADASSSLLLNYASASLPVVLFKSIKKAHGAVVWSSVVALVISICVPLASETLYISTSGTCSSTEDGSDCEPSLASRPALARVEQALVGVIFLIVAYLAVWYRRRQSGIYAEATSIVGVATLLHDPIVLDDLRRISPHASASEIEKILENRKYGLGSSSGRGLSSGYGLIILGGAPTSPPEKETGRHLPVPSDNENKAANPKSLRQSGWKAKRAPSLRVPALIAFWVTLAGLLALIIYYRFSGPRQTGVPTRSGFERFMDSQSIGVRFLTTALGVLIKHIWTLIEKSELALPPLPPLTSPAPLEADKTTPPPPAF